MDEKLSAKLIPKVEIIRPKSLLVEPGGLGAVISCSIRDTKTGKLEFKKEFVSKSFLKNWLCYMFVIFAGGAQNCPTPDNQRVTDTAGVISDTIYQRSDNLATNAPVNIATWGIQVGTGIGVPALTDNVLGTLIAHGIGAGQLQYSAMVYGAPSDDGVTSQFTCTRDFANASGGAINVQEIGLTMYQTTPHYVLLIRDLTGGINVLNGKTLTINYQIQANV